MLAALHGCPAWHLSGHGSACHSVQQHLLLLGRHNTKQHTTPSPVRSRSCPTGARLPVECTPFQPPQPPAAAHCPHPHLHPRPGHAPLHAPQHAPLRRSPPSRARSTPGVRRRVRQAGRRAGVPLRPQALVPQQPCFRTCALRPPSYRLAPRRLASRVLLSTRSACRPPPAPAQTPPPPPAPR